MRFKLYEDNRIKSNRSFFPTNIDDSVTTEIEEEPVAEEETAEPDDNCEKSYGIFCIPNIVMNACIEFTFASNGNVSSKLIASSSPSAESTRPLKLRDTHSLGNVYYYFYNTKEDALSRNLGMDPGSYYVPSKEDGSCYYVGTSESVIRLEYEDDSFYLYFAFYKIKLFCTKFNTWKEIFEEIGLVMLAQCGLPAAEGDKVSKIMGWPQERTY